MRFVQKLFLLGLFFCLTGSPVWAEIETMEELRAKNLALREKLAKAVLAHPDRIPDEDLIPPGWVVLPCTGDRVRTAFNRQRMRLYLEIQKQNKITDGDFARINKKGWELFAGSVQAAEKRAAVYGKPAAGSPVVTIPPAPREFSQFLTSYAKMLIGVLGEERGYPLVQRIYMDGTWSVETTRKEVLLHRPHGKLMLVAKCDGGRGHSAGWISQTLIRGRPTADHPKVWRYGHLFDIDAVRRQMEKRGKYDPAKDAIRNKGAPRVEAEKPAPPVGKQEDKTPEFRRIQAENKRLQNEIRRHQPTNRFSLVANLHRAVPPEYFHILLDSTAHEGVPRIKSTFKYSRGIAMADGRLYKRSRTLLNLPPDTAASLEKEIGRITRNELERTGWSTGTGRGRDGKPYQWVPNAMARSKEYRAKLESLFKKTLHEEHVKILTEILNFE